jgi:hypothetical protein
MMRKNCILVLIYARLHTSVSMTINGPAATICAFFMNAAIDQECEKYIQQNNLEEEVNKKIDEIYKNKNTKRPTYNGDLPDGNNGLRINVVRCNWRPSIRKRSV